MRSELLKVVIFVPESHANVVREAGTNAGAGKIGNYSACTFSIKGIGRFIPEEGAHPHEGTVGVLQESPMERIEFRCEREKLEEFIRAVEEVHPYEEIGIDVYSLDSTST
jgi:hypothetical protein